MADLSIAVHSERLTDDSEVFNVVVQSPDGSITVKFPAITEHDAGELVEKLATAIEAHTAFSVEIRDAH